MDILKYVIRKCERSDGYTNWMALYKDGHKELETYSFDINLILDNYGSEIKYILDLIIEDEIEFIESKYDLFPDYEDFSYLLDNNKLNIGSYIFLEDGMFEVEHIESDFRPSGTYKMKHWEKIGNRFFSSEFDIEWYAHSITKFKVKGVEHEFIWEDYSYQQSYLYLYLKEIGKII